jgi:hypothetical protein
VVFDLKQSKYKKLGKLLDKFEKDKVGGCLYGRPATAGPDGFHRMFADYKAWGRG